MTTCQRLPAVARLARGLVPPPPPRTYDVSEPEALYFLVHGFMARTPNLIAYAAYADLWRKRRGMLMTSKDPDADCYQVRLLMAQDKVSPGAISRAFTHRGHTSPHFWLVRRRVEIFLSYCKLTASQVLVDLGGYPPEMFRAWAPFKESPEMLVLVDWFNEPQETVQQQRDMTTERLVFFSEYLLAKRYLRKQNIMLAVAIAEVAMDADQQEWNRASAYLSGMLKGSCQGWNTRTLGILAAHKKLDWVKLVPLFCDWLEKEMVAPPVLPEALPVAA